ncbi:Acidic leucine-rich nuclear phosphoprotein 32-related protein, variant 2 [Balamuthia mandrillaris]
MKDQRQHRLYARIKEEDAQHELVSEKQVFQPLLWKRWFEMYALRSDKESPRCMRKVIFEKTRKAFEKGYYFLSDGHKVELCTSNDHANADQQERAEDKENEEVKEVKEVKEEEEAEAEEEEQETEGDREASLIDFTGQLQQLNNGTRESDHRFKGRHCYRDPYTQPRTYEMIPEAKAEEGVKNTTKVSVIEMDSLEVAQHLLTNGYNPCTLMFSSNTFPSSKSGAEKSGGQEGSIYQRTNLYQILSKSKWEDQFPLPEFAAIYIPTLTILRSDEKQGCAFLQNSVQAACISIAAYSRPKLLPSTSATPQGEPAMTMRFMDKTKTKMKVVLQVALDKGHDAVVLGAIGCGAFANPPMAVALLWKEVLASDFEGCFKRVIFAVLGLYIPFTCCVLVNNNNNNNRDGKKRSP